jgi:hypothetical protein
MQRTHFETLLVCAGDVGEDTEPLVKLGTGVVGGHFAGADAGEKGAAQGGFVHGVAWGSREYESFPKLSMHYPA